MKTVAPSQVGKDFVKFDFAPNQMYVSLDAPSQILKFTVNVPQNNYFSIGFGATMTNTDMITWTAKQASSTTVNMWSVKNIYTPTADPN